MRSPSQRHLAAVILGGLLVAACGGADDGDASFTLDAEAPGEEVSAGEDARVATDTEPAGPGFGFGFGERCAENRDCASGYCVPSPSGLVCSRGCTPSCPDGWICGRILDAGVDAARVCLSRATTLCQPCLDDSACADLAAGGVEGARCLSYGDAGRFCGLPCSPQVPCPTDYACVDPATDAAAASGQCRRVTDACSCNDVGRALGLFTTCSVSAAGATCTGTRACGEAGLEACSAAPPSDEACNGRDDDCDGVIDDGLPLGGDCTVDNDFGRCPGREVCTGGEVRCVGAPAEPERCDGFDQDCDGARDEGFPDLDADGEADCVDGDEDGDGTPNAEDCAPREAARSRAATEVCNGVDDDCDGALDEAGATGCSAFYADVDGDTFGSNAAPALCLCAADPATSRTATAAGDCDDLSAAVNPRGSETCNGADDNCNRLSDEGVEAPCGGCVNLCLLASGPGTARSFTLGPHTSNLALDPVGNLQLAVGQIVGTYRQVLAGWPLGGTAWQALFLGVTTPSGTSVRARWRTAASPGALALTPWGTWSGTLPPATSPLWLDATAGTTLEVEVELRSTSLAVTPALSRVELLAGAAP